MGGWAPALDGRLPAWSLARVWVAVGLITAAARCSGVIYLALRHGREILSVLAAGAVDHPVMFGTISGEILNLTVIASLWLLLTARDKRLALVPWGASLTVGLASGLAFVLWQRERAGAREQGALLNDQAA